MGDVTVHVYRFAASGLQVVDLITSNHQITDRSLRCTVSGDAESVPVLFFGGRDVVDQIVQQLDALARARDPDARRSVRDFAGSEIADFESTDNDVALIHYIDETLRPVPARRRV